MLGTDTIIYMITNISNAVIFDYEANIIQTSNHIFEEKSSTLSDSMKIFFKNHNIFQSIYKPAKLVDLKSIFKVN